MNEEIKYLIKNTPSDEELGKKIRALYYLLFANESKNNNNNKQILLG